MRNIFILFCFLVSHASWAQREIPPLWGHHVHDDAHILSPSTIDSLELMLTKHEDSTSNQIAIYTIQSLGDDVLEELSLRVAHDEWKLGKSNHDNGVLLLIAVDDHKMRIEVGDGLEGVLTDARSSQIIRNEIAPHFREGEYDAGVMAGTKGIIASIAGEYSAEENASDTGTWKERLFLGIFIFGILGIFTTLGLFAGGCAGWFLYAFLIPFYATFPMFILGNTGGVALLATYVVGMPIAKLLIGRTAWGKNISKKVNNGNRKGFGGWSSGSGWSGGSGSGGGWSSGGGFSGGGGSFSGGGSSGSW